MLSEPYTVASDYTTIADDHLLPILVRKTGLEIVDIASFADCRWRATHEPQGLEKEGVYIFHPSKLVPGAESSAADLRVRNYFRRLRGQEDLT
jgi:hypothetical protein